jgi:hypothetical protein
MICLYQAPDAEAVRHANRMAGVPFDRVWPAQVLAPEMAWSRLPMMPGGYSGNPARRRPSA